MLRVDLALKKFREEYDLPSVPLDCFALLRDWKRKGPDSLDLTLETTGEIRDGFDAVVFYFPGEDCYLVITPRPPVGWKNHSAKRRINFTLAHELGHIVLGHVKIPPKYKNRDTLLLEDREADAFAAGLLMPEEVMGLFRSPREASVSLLVSETAAARRMRELGIPMEKKTCPACGFHVPPGARFCRMCGEQLLPGPNPMDPPEVFFLPPLEKTCPLCGGETPFGGELCRNCGVSRRNFCCPEYDQPRHFCPPDARYCEICHAETEYRWWRETKPALESRRPGEAGD